PATDPEGFGRVVGGLLADVLNNAPRSTDPETENDDCAGCANLERCFVRNRKEIILKTGEVVCDFVYSRGIPRIIFLDRAARNGAVVVDETWKQRYPDQTPPQLVHVNPRGFDLPELRMVYESGRKYHATHGGSVRLAREIQEQGLITNDPVLIFDTCMHNGVTMDEVVYGLVDNGQSDILTGVFNAYNIRRGIDPPDLVIDKKSNICHPFGMNKYDRYDVQLTTDQTIISKPNTDPKALAYNATIQKLIREIIRGEI
ncbi:hypothetical protein FWF74_00020, partial [Candidatus Saccharibacteria bacterium]|nr:hypothetical protein [Candidatus Saccharibacteria bacterium]